MKKRALSFLLLLAMIFSLAMPVYADNDTSAAGGEIVTEQNLEESGAPGEGGDASGGDADLPEEGGDVSDNDDADLPEEGGDDALTPDDDEPEEPPMLRGGAAPEGEQNGLRGVEQGSGTFTVVAHANEGAFWDGSTVKEFSGITSFHVEWYDIDCDDPHRVFDAWYRDEECTDFFCGKDDTVALTEDLELYAGWTDCYLITYHSGEGYFNSVPSLTEDSVKVPVNGNVRNWPAVNIDDANASFDHWNMADGTRIYDLEGFYPDSDTDLYAVYKYGFTVTFDANGGCFYGDENVLVREECFEESNLIWFTDSHGATNNDPAMKFGGWYFDAECTQPISNEGAYYPSGAVTLYAKWIRFHKVTFVGGGGYFYGDQAQTTIDVYTTPGDVMGSSYRETPVKTDLHEAFAGWTDANGAAVDLDSFAPAGDATLYATWGEGWLVTFDGNGGYINGDPNEPTRQISVLKGNTINKSFAVYSDDNTKRGNGWYLTADCSGQAIDPWSYAPTQDTRLYSRLVEKILYTLDGNGGHVWWDQSISTNQVSVWEGEEIQLRNFSSDFLAAEDGLVLNGWYADRECTQLLYGAKGTLVGGDQPTTLYAGWAQGYVVTLDANGGSFGNGNTPTKTYVVLPGDVLDPDYGQVVPLEQQLHHTDNSLSFAGWFTDTSFTQQVNIWDFTPQGDVTLYAKWAQFNYLTLNAGNGYFWGGPENRTIRYSVEKDSAFDARNAVPTCTDPMKVFAGWYAESALETLVCAAGGSFVPAGDMTLYAAWDDAPIVNMGENSVEIMNGNEPVMVFTPQESGYYAFKSAMSAPKFIHILENGNCIAENSEYDNMSLVVELSAGVTYQVVVGNWGNWNGDFVFTVEKPSAVYTITFDANGGYFWGNPDVTEITHLIVAGDQIGIHPEARNPGDHLAFAFWGSDAGEYITDDNISFFAPTGDMTLHAEWQQGWIVTFDGNGGYLWGSDDITRESYVVPIGQRISYVPSVRSADGQKVVNGWFLNSPDGEYFTREDFEEYDLTSDVTFYANLVDACTITLDANGGWFWEDRNQTTLETTHAQGEPIYRGWDPAPMHHPDATKVFGGWYFDRACTQYVFASGEAYFPDSDQTFYAKWIDPLPVTLGVNNVQVFGGAKQIMVFTPEESGYYVFSADADVPKSITIYDNGMILGDRGTYDSISIVVELQAGTTYRVDAGSWENWTGEFDFTVEKTSAVYTVTFDGNGGYLWGSDSITTETFIVAAGHMVMEDPFVCSADGSKEGRGWFINSPDGEFIREIYSYIPTEDVTFYARLVDVYHITLNANGGYYWDNLDETRVVASVEQGSSIDNYFYADCIHHVDPQLAFAGWYFDQDCTQPVFGDDSGFEYTPESDITLYAKWEEGWTVTFDAGLGHFENNPDLSQMTIMVAKGMRIGDSPYVLVDDDSLGFFGWMLEDGTEINAWEYVPTGNVTLYAVIVPSWSLTLNAGEGGYFWEGSDSSVETAVIRRGEEFYWGYFDIQNVNPQLVFAGWYYDEELTELAVPRGGHIYPESNLTLYAKWEEGYTITLDANGGYLWNDPDVTEETIRVPHGGNVGFGGLVGNANPHLAFAGWLSDTGEFVGKYDIYQYVPTSDMVLHAQWVEGWVITYNADDGYIYGDPTLHQIGVGVVKGEAIGDTPYVEVPDDNIFHFGWMLEDGTEIDPWDYVPTGDLTLYAVILPGWTVTMHAGEGAYFWEPGMTSTKATLRVDESFYSMCYELLNEDPNLGFEGWYYDEELTNLAVVRGGEICLNENVDLYAKWNEAWQVTFDAGVGYLEGDPNRKSWTVPVSKGSAVAAAPSVTVEGDSLRFFGWKLPDGSWVDDLWSFYPTEDVTLTAAIEPYWGLILIAGEGGYFPENGKGKLGYNFTMDEYFWWDRFEIANEDPDMAFAGWYYDEACTQLAVARGDGLYSPEESQTYTYYAKWTSDCCTVTFDGNGGFIWGDESQTSYSVKVPINMMIGFAPSVLSPDDNSDDWNAGWYLNDPVNGEIIRYAGEYCPTEDVTLYARFPAKYLITFDANGGWFGDDVTSATNQEIVYEGDSVYFASDYNVHHPNDRMAFEGWYFDENCTQPVPSDIYYPGGDMTFYAKWAEGWIITLNGNGGKIWAPNGELVDQLQIPVAKGLAVGTSFSVETDEDHTFRGYWYADSEMTGARIDLYNYRPSSDVTLYAGILPCYEVTFHAGEGYFRTEDTKTYSEKIAKGELIGKGTHGVEISDPHKTLDGWYLDAALTQAADLNKYTVDGPVDLYAKWTQGWTVTFHMPRGDRSIKVKDGDPLSTAVAEPVVAYSSDESQSFAYWCYDQAGNNPVENVYAVLITRDFDFYPSWTESVTITWKSDSWESKQTIKKGSYTEFAAGHVWYWDSDCTKPADPFSVKMDEDVTFYMPSSDPAKCVNVTFDLNGGIFSDGSVVMKNSIVVTVMKGQPLQDEAFSTPYFGYNADTKYKKDGCALEGWTLTKNGTDFLDFSSTFTKDTTVYAKWTDAHTVTFDGNGKRIRLGYYDSADYVNSFTLNVKIEDSIAGCLEKAFYDLIFDETDEWVVEGWYYDSACTRPLSSTDTAKQTTLYAKWVKPCTLTFDFNGGFGYNDTLKAIPGKPLRNGMYAYSGDDRYIQTGWSTDRAGTSPIEEIWNYVPNGDVTLYAQWAKGYRINFVSEYPFSDGYYSNRIEVFDGDSIGNVSWLDYGCDRAIIGWYYDRALTRSAGDVSKLIPTESLTLYAEWGDKSPLPVIKTQPTDQTVGVGKTATFKVVAEDADSYQWYYLAPGGEWTQVSSAAGKTATYSFTAAERHNGYQYCCVISNKSGEIETDVVTLTVVSKPIISLTTPSDITVVEGQSATFVVYAENAVSYQWQYQKPGTTTWTNVSTNGTDPWYTLSAAELRHDGYKYRCTATNPAGTTTGDPVSLNVVEALAITAQPVDKSAKEGATVSFSVTAKGVKEYQWYFRVAEDADWIKASAASATTATYSVTTTAVHNGYQYYCHLTGKDGTTVDSNVVTLTVTAKPVVTTPSDVVKVAVYVGDPAEFEIGAIGEDLTYQWSYQKPGTSTWTNVSSNGTAAKYTLAAAELRHDGYKYRCTVKNAAGSATSPVFTLTVTEIFRITKQPTDVKVKEGATATFSVTATGVISYQWQYQKPGETTWTNVSATSGKTATYSFTTKASHEGNKYRCELISAEGPVYTDEATLTFLPKPVITQEPESISVEAGEKATFTVAADDATGYQWSYQKPGETSWTNVSSNGTSASYSLTAAARHSGYKYRCTVKNDAGSTVSAAATLTVEIVISAQPSVTPKDIGETAAFKVTATGASSYQWQYQKPGTSTWTNVSADSGKTANYTMTVKATHEGNTYRCELKNATETVYTDEVVLELKPKPEITQEPESITVNAGEKATFTVAATGASSYQWSYQKPGETSWTNVSSNGTSASYSLTAAARHSGYKYRCTVKNGAGSTVSEAATLTVEIVISAQPSVTPKNIGETAAFKVTATGASSYQWQYQKPGETTWTNVSATSGKTANYTMTVKATHEGNTYRCELKNATETVYTDEVVLELKPKPVINSEPESISVDNGTAVTFTVEAENAESYQWYYQKPGTSTWTAVSAASGKTASYSMTAEGRHSGYKYRCTVKNGAGSVNSEAAELIVNIKIETQPASKTVTAGKTAKFTVAAAGATSYQWQYQKPGTSTWTNVSSNGTSASYSLTTAARHNGYKYRCLVKNATESVVSEVATLTVK